MEEDAKSALAKLDGWEVSGSTIRARMEAGGEGRPEGGGGGGRRDAPLARPRPRGGKGNGGRFDDSGRILYFSNLPQSFAWQVNGAPLAAPTSPNIRTLCLSTPS